MALITNLYILLYLIFNISNSQCFISSPTLPDKFDFLQSEYVPSLNTLYLFGSSSDAISSVHTWDVSGSLQWIHQLDASYDFGSYAAATALIDNLIYFVGVFGESGLILIFDTNTNTFLDNSNIPDPPNRGMDGCVVHNTTHIFMVGGDANGVVGDALQIYNIAQNSWWSEQIAMSEVQDHNWWAQYCWMVADVLYVFGGVIDSSGALDSVFTWKWNDGWSTVTTATLPDGRGTGRAAKHPSDDNIWIIGGYNGDTIVNEIYQFNLITHSITNTYYMNTRSDTPTTDFIGDDLYIFGGFYDTKPQAVSDETQECQGLVSTTTTSTTPTTTSSSTSTTSLSTTTIATPTTTLYTDTTSTSSTQATISSTTTDATTNAPQTTHIPQFLSTETAQNTDTTLILTSSTIAHTKHTESVFSTVLQYDVDHDEVGADAVAPAVAPNNVVLSLSGAGLGCIAFICAASLYCFWKKKLKRRNTADDINVVTNVEMQTNIITPNDEYNAVLVSWFVHTIELPEYLQVFVDNGYDDVLMLELIEDKSQLIEIGVVCHEHQELIMKEINKLRLHKNNQVPKKMRPSPAPIVVQHKQQEYKTKKASFEKNEIRIHFDRRRPGEKSVVMRGSSQWKYTVEGDAAADFSAELSNNAIFKKKKKQDLTISEGNKI